MLPSLKNTTKKKLLQFGSLYAANFSTLIIGLLISIFNTRNLNPNDYGDLKFVSNAFQFLSLFFSFGFFSTITNVLSEEKDNTRSLMGLNIIFTGFVSLIFTFFIMLVSYPQQLVFHNSLGWVMRISAPFVFALIFEISLQNSLLGTNNIGLLSILKVAPKLFYLLLAYFYARFYTFSVESSLIIQLSVYLPVVIWIIFFIRPRFDNLKANFQKIWHKNKKVGLPIYQGSILGVASSYVSIFLLSYLNLNNIDLGFVSLAITVTTPLTIVPSSLGGILFREFAQAPKIDRKIIIITFMISAFAFIVFFFAIKPVVVLFYSTAYLPVVKLSYYIAFGALLHGFGDFYNRFIWAKGQGNFLRKVAVIVGLFNIVIHTLLVYFWRANGVAVGKIVSGFLFFALTYYYYKKTCRLV